MSADDFPVLQAPVGAIFLMLTPLSSAVGALGLQPVMAEHHPADD